MKQGDALYLCFEDSQIRIQNRLFEITDEVSASVNFCIEQAILGGELEERIRTFVEEHPNCVLIIMDTLQMIRGSSTDNSYASDYSDLSVLKNIADELGIDILLIHHLRKENNNANTLYFHTIGRLTAEKFWFLDVLVNLKDLQRHMILFMVIIFLRKTLNWKIDQLLKYM